MIGFSYSGWHHLEVEEIVKETDWAFLLKLKDGKEIWMPKSQIKDADSYAHGDGDCTVSITEYIAKKRKFV